MAFQSLVSGSVNTDLVFLNILGLWFGFLTVRTQGHYDVRHSNKSIERVFFLAWAAHIAVIEGLAGSVKTFGSDMHSRQGVVDTRLDTLLWEWSFSLLFRGYKSLVPVNYWFIGIFR